MIKTAHLILTYKNPEQLSRLVKAIKHPNAEIFIHVDRKVEIKPFLKLAETPGVHFIEKRHYIVWGGYSITKCYIDSMEEIMSKGTFDYIVLMSGQDYPLKPIDEFHRHLKQNNGYSIMSVEKKTPSSRWWRYAHERFLFYHFNDFKFFGRKFVHKLSKRILPGRNFVFPDYELYGGPGATFCALTSDAAGYVVNFMKKHTNARRFAQLTHASDEFWFQTLLMNSPYRDKIINQPLWYIDWGGMSKHPRILTVLDYPSLVQSEMFFGRKFDMYVDETVLDMLDTHLIERKALRPALTM